jgi:hypothetical protein
MVSITIEALAKKFQSLKERFEKLEEDVKGLKDVLNVHDNWHSTIRRWIGKKVMISDRSGYTVGILKWSDRYNVCLEVMDDRSGVSPRMYNKGSINWIELD